MRIMAEVGLSWYNDRRKRKNAFKRFYANFGTCSKCRAINPMQNQTSLKKNKPLEMFISNDHTQYSAFHCRTFCQARAEEQENFVDERDLASRNGTRKHGVLRKGPRRRTES